MVASSNLRFFLIVIVIKVPFIPCSVNFTLLQRPWLKSPVFIPTYIFTLDPMAQHPHLPDCYGQPLHDPPRDVPYNPTDRTFDDSTASTYIPRATRAVPQAHTVHTIYLKRVCHPSSSRPDELILELNSDSLETWCSIESFLGTLRLSNHPRILRAVANQWRLHYDIGPISHIQTSHHISTLNYHILNIQTSILGNLSSVIPDHTSILQACWGRSAHRHSQRAPTSLFWPPTPSYTTNIAHIFATTCSASIYCE